MAGYRYTMADISRLVDRLNREVGAEPRAYRDATEEEKAAGFYAVANIGTYYLMGAYGGQKLVQITTHGGGVRDVLNIGYGSKREVYRALSAYLDGIVAASPDSHYAVAAIRERAGSIEEAMRQNIERRERFAKEQEDEDAPSYTCPECGKVEDYEKGVLTDDGLCCSDCAKEVQV